MVLEYKFFLMAKFTAAIGKITNDMAMVHQYLLIMISIVAFGKRTQDTAWVSLSKLNKLILVIGMMTTSMDMVKCNGQMVMSIRVIGRKDKKMEKVQ
jgi:hypothetical protein